MPFSTERWDNPTEQDLLDYAALMSASFGSTVEQSTRWLERIGPAQARLLLMGDRLAAALASYDMGIFFQGRSVPCWGIAGVVVQPEHRRLGLACALMRRTLEEAHERRVPLSSLYAANHPLYRGVGYDTAGTYAMASIAPDRIHVVERAGSIRRFRPDDEPVRRKLYQRMAATRTGHVDRDAALWSRATHDRDGKPLPCWIAIGPSGEPEGYVTLHPSKGDVITQAMDVADIAAVSPWAVRRLLCFLGDHASVVGSVRFPSSPSCPFLRSLPEPRVSWKPSMTWLLRIVSVKPALEARGWLTGVSGSVELELRDEVLPGNAGRWILEVEEGRARLGRGGSGAVKLGARGLATIYGGLVSPIEAADIGLLEGPDADLALLGAMLSGPHPWAVDAY